MSVTLSTDHESGITVKKEQTTGSEVNTENRSTIVRRILGTPRGAGRVDARLIILATLALGKDGSYHTGPLVRSVRRDRVGLAKRDNVVNAGEISSCVLRI